MTTIKDIAAAALALLLLPAYAGEGMLCAKLEYARLKDSSREELKEEYCSAVQAHKYNVDLLEIKQQHGMATVKIMEELHAAQASCLAAANEASRMLSIKFKAAKPTCPLL